MEEVSALKVRMKFSKQGEMRFIGHLDLMRYFQKAIRRADIPIRFSEGMSPHMIMSFASPLGVGLTSDGEYMDIELTESISTQEALSRLNEQMAEGVRVLDFRKIEEGKAGKAMSLVAAADYTVTFRDGCEPFKDWPADVVQFFSKDKIEVLKKTKKGESLVDIRPMIYQICSLEGALQLRLASGSETNLKPELVMAAWAEERNIPLAESSLRINRLELYANSQDGGEHRFISLNDLGEVLFE